MLNCLNVNIGGLVLMWLVSQKIRVWKVCCTVVGRPPGVEHQTSISFRDTEYDRLKLLCESNSLTIDWATGWEAIFAELRVCLTGSAAIDTIV